MKVRERLGFSDRRQRQVSRLLQVALVAFVVVGLLGGDPGVVVNAGVALAVTSVPALAERDYGVTMDPALTLWLTGAVFLHALGTVGVPGGPGSLYGRVPWWDHLTHALSASVVAAAGYAVVRAVDVHRDDVSLTRRFTFVFLLLFVVAFGVLWEVLEFAIGLAADRLGTAAVLTQYGLDDTMLDLVFDVVGGVVTAAWGTAYLSGLTDAIADRLTRARRGR